MTSLSESERFRAQYHPCETGLHVVGIDDDSHDDSREFGPHRTEANYHFGRAEDARAMFTAARIECAEGDEVNSDLIVDLMIGGVTENEFGMMRQMLPALHRSVTGDQP